MARRRRQAVALAVAVLGTFTLAACGDDDDDVASTGTTEAESAGEGEASDASDSVEIKMVDYGYEVSGALKAGGTVKISNTGAEFHMIGIGKLKEGKTLEDVTDALGGGEEAPAGEGEGDGEGSAPAPGGLVSYQLAAAEEPATEEPATEEEQDPFAEILDDFGMPGSIMGPGSAADVIVPELGEGNYALICFLNVEGEETPHFAKGMVGELEVVADEAEAPAEPDATYTASAGKAIEGPAVLTAGRHLLKIDAAGDGADALEPGIIKLNDGETAESFAKALAVFEESLPADAASKIPGEFIIGLFDYGDNGTVYLDLDLDPGTYLLTAQDSDAEDAPDVPVELIEIKVT